MGNEIEKQLKAQTEVESKTTGNLINDKRIRTSSLNDFNSSEESGVIEVNWKGLFQDCKYAWMTVAGFLIILMYGIMHLTNGGYFENKLVSQEKAKVKILEVTNYFGKKILISGEITNHLPIEVRLPQKCVVDARWIGAVVELSSKEYKSDNSKISRFEFSGVENLCNSTEGYKRAKEEKEKMKELVNKISSYDLLPNFSDPTDSHNTKTSVEKQSTTTKILSTQNKEKVF